MRDSSKAKIDISFIRHGKTAGNLEGRYIGRTDEDLCPEGRKNLLENLYPEAEIIFASPMKRCKETASIIYPGRDYIEIEEFREIDFGLFEGKNYAELNGNPDYQAWIDSGGTIAFPKGESRIDFIERNLKGYEKMCSIIKEKNVTQVSVIAHGGTAMAILANVLGGDYFDYQIKNGEQYKCSIIL